MYNNPQRHRYPSFLILFICLIISVPNVLSDIAGTIVTAEIIMDYYNERLPFINPHVEELEKIVRNSSSPIVLEGNAFYEHSTFNRKTELVTKQANLLYYARDAKNILEIGFNAGHSSLLFLFGTHHHPIDEYMIFDIVEHPYVEPAVRYLSRTFSTTAFTLSPGDSRLTLTQYVLQHPESIGKYDLVHVDGGHSDSCYVSDMAHAVLLVKKGGIIIVDDVHVSFIRNHLQQLINSKLFSSVPILETEFYPHAIVRKNI